MPFHPCPSGCGRFLSADDGHDRCLQCLGFQHAEDAFVDDSCVCLPPGKGRNRASPSSREEAGVLQPLLHRTQETWWPSTNPGSASFEPGFTQAPVQDADAQAHYQMHPALGLVCTDRPEGCLLSCFDPSATQTVPTFLTELKLNDLHLVVMD